jgi:heptaprenyl diphosphate synthase
VSTATGFPDVQPLDIAALSDAAAADEAPAALAAPLRRVLGNRGKGIRPAIVLEAARCGPRASDASVRLAASAVELLHVATIVHDDVLDRGELRRGAPTVAAEHGSHMAVTVGVWLLGRVAELLIDCGGGVLAHASRSIVCMCDGQLLEARDLFNPNRTIADYLRTIEGKTAALFALAAWLGAKLADASAPTVQTLERYGHHLGIAYQIADDLRDLRHEHPTDTAHSDIRQGIYTLPVLYAIQAEPRLRTTLNSNLDPNDIERVTETIARTGALARAHQLCHHHVRAAENALHQTPTPKPLLQELPQLILGMCDG